MNLDDLSLRLKLRANALPGEGANARAALDHARAVIATRKPGQRIYISNNLPYINRLNEGHSAQAPAMFVQAAIQAAVRAVRTTLIDTGRPGISGGGGLDG